MWLGAHFEPVPIIRRRGFVKILSSACFFLYCFGLLLCMGLWLPGKVCFYMVCLPSNRLVDLTVLFTSSSFLSGSLWAAVLSTCCSHTFPTKSKTAAVLQVFIKGWKNLESYLHRPIKWHPMSTNYQAQRATFKLIFYAANKSILTQWSI